MILPCECLTVSTVHYLLCHVQLFHDGFDDVIALGLLSGMLSLTLPPPPIPPTTPLGPPPPPETPPILYLSLSLSVFLLLFLHLFLSSLYLYICINICLFHFLFQGCNLTHGLFPWQRGACRKPWKALRGVSAPEVHHGLKPPIHPSTHPCIHLNPTIHTCL